MAVYCKCAQDVVKGGCRERVRERKREYVPDGWIEMTGRVDLRRGFGGHGAGPEVRNVRYRCLRAGKKIK